jgi:hypothetical protein
VRFSWALDDLIGTAEYIFHQSRDNTLPDGVWMRCDATLGWWLSHPGLRAWWRARPSPFSSDFEAFAEDLIRDDRFDKSAVDRWRAFVAGGGFPGTPAPDGKA